MAYILILISVVTNAKLLELIYYKYLGGEKITDLANLSESLTLAARHALLQMIDYIVDEYGLSREQAYILCSVAADLRVGQVVDVPNYIVTAVSYTHLTLPTICSV